MNCHRQLFGELGLVFLLDGFDKLLELFESCNGLALSFFREKKLELLVAHLVELLQFRFDSFQNCLHPLHVIEQ